MNIPNKSPENIAAFTAEEEACKNIPSAVNSLFTAVSEEISSSYHLLLDGCKGFFADDGFVVISHIILRRVGLVLSAFLLERVISPGFLQKGITYVFLICQDLLDIAFLPF